MGRPVAVASLTLFLLFRRGSAFMLLGLSALVAIFIFWVSRADGQLSHELQLRSRYALHFSTALFGVGLLWTACMSMRGDIESKRMHLLTSYPVTRRAIYLGKWLGLGIYGAAGLLTLMVVVGLCNQVMIWQWPASEEKAALRESSWRAFARVTPERRDLESMIDERSDELVSQGRLQEESVDAEVRERLRMQLLYDLHLLKTDGQKRWEFEFGPTPRYGEGITVRYRYLSSTRREENQLTWRVMAPRASQPFEMTGSSYSFADNQFVIPWESIPEDGTFALQVSGTGNPELVFYRTDGVALYYASSHFANNALKFWLVMSCHYAAIVAVGLSIGVAFTASVASFVAVVIYLLSLASGFFQGFLRDLREDAHAGALEQLGAVSVQLGTFFTTGLEPPTAIYLLTEQLEIGLANIGMSMTVWFGGLLLAPVNLVTGGGAATEIQLILGFLVYVLIAAGIGISLVTSKELDRVH